MSSRHLIVPGALACLALVLALPTVLVAQEEPAPQSLKEISGTWRLDESRSDPVPDVPTVTPPRRVAETTAVSVVVTGHDADAGAARAAAGAAADRAVAGAARATADGPPPTAARGGGGGRGGESRYLRQLLAQMQAPATLIIRAEETTVSLSVPNGAPPTEWPTTGKKRQKAQLDGTLLEFNGRWERGKLTLIDAIAGTAELKREFRVEDKGQVLQLQYAVSGTGVPRKMERKVVYRRVE